MRASETSYLNQEALCGASPLEVIDRMWCIQVLRLATAPGLHQNTLRIRILGGPELLVASLLLVVMPGARSSFWFLVVRPGAASSILGGPDVM